MGAGANLVEHGSVEQICPGVQKPYWKPSCFMKAACMGCSLMRRAHAFDGGDPIAVLHQSKRQARVDPAAVDDDRATAALAVIEALPARALAEHARAAARDMLRGWQNCPPVALLDSDIEAYAAEYVKPVVAEYRRVFLAALRAEAEARG